LRGYEAGAVDYIQKPIDDFILISKVSVFLELYNNRQQLSRELVRSEAMRVAASVSESRLRESIVNSPYPIMMHVEDGQILMLSQAWTDITGYDLNNMRTTRIWANKAYGIQAELAQQRLKKLFDLQEVKNEGQYEIKTASGEIRLWDFQSQPLQKLPDGRRVVLSLATDITERKKAESELRIAATAFESQEGVTVTDAEGNILRVNQAFTTITGYTTEDVLGKNSRLLKSGRHNARFYHLMWASILNTGAWSGEIWNRRKNGEAYPEHLNITAVKDLNGTITNYVATFNDRTQNKVAEEEIKNLAFYDPLTRLPNRRLLLDRLQLAFASSSRSGREGAILFIDLDNFKTLNDTLGHDIGDLLLQQVAQRLELGIREGDTVSRLGGDEFVVMLKDLSKNTNDAAKQTESIGEHLLAALNEPYLLGTHEYRNTPSIGATLFSNYQNSTDDLLKQADIAMYQAKKAGRNTLRFYDPQMQETINIRAALENGLRTALDEKQFHLYYQLQVDSSQRPIGAEALIRWLHPKRGLISPAQFISLAEDTRLILPIGQWVIETACKQIKDWQGNILTRNLVLAVNVSAKQFRQDGFVDQVQSAMKLHAISPRLLKLELTESLLLEDIDATIATMSALQTIGVHFSLDDFGTGFSSLQYLKRLPLNQLKIDQSFVRDITSDSNDLAIVRTIIAMAQSLNLDVIAEGVETEQQKLLLQGNGCDHFQGYLFGKPMTINEFNALLYSGGILGG
jgi:diguanylate cyclase (GGDEF)-like protein/PAS domain S-box-containing protein